MKPLSLVSWIQEDAVLFYTIYVEIIAHTADTEHQIIVF